MQPWMFAIVATIISFIVFKFVNTKKHVENDPTISNESATFSDLTTFGFIFVGCMIISYWFNFTGSSVLGEEVHSSINAATLSDDMERNIVNNIIQDINVGFLPF